MSKLKIFLTLAIIFSITRVKAQYVDVDLNLMHEKTGTEILPFGFPDSKEKPLTSKDVNLKTFTGKGIYSLTATENLRVLVTVSYSDKLMDKKRKKIPFDIEMSYQNNGTNNEKSAIETLEKHASFELSNCGKLINEIKTEANRVSAFVYLKGKIEATDEYIYPLKGDITLTAEYE